MAVKITENETYETIEELKAKAGTTDAVFLGVKMAQGWKTGKKVTEKEYKDAVAAFNNAPIDGRTV